MSLVLHAAIVFGIVFVGACLLGTLQVGAADGGRPSQRPGGRTRKGGGGGTAA
jgi:hypothetical protein